MVADGSGGVDFDAFVESCCGDDFSKDDFCGWRAADVAHADEEDEVRLAVVGHWG